MDTLINEFLEYIRLNDSVSKNTLESYDLDLKKYMHYLDERSIKAGETSKTMIIAYFNYLKSLNLSEATLARHLSSIRSFHQYLLDKGIVMKDPTYGFKLPKVEKKKAEVLSKEEIEILLCNQDLASEKENRFFLILQCALYLGLSASELVNLKVEDIHFDMGYVLVRNERKEKFIALGNFDWQYLKSYIEKRERDAYVFSNNRGEQLTRQGLWKIIKYGPQNIEITPQILKNTHKFYFA